MTVTATMTPGPWSFALEADPHTARHVGYRIRSGDVVVAEAFVRPYQVAINEANARILAAAPDLLAALKSILPYAESRLEDMVESCSGAIDACGSAGPKADAALMKASAAFNAALAAIDDAEGRR